MLIMFKQNKLVVICVIFTILTVTSSLLGLIQGNEATANFHILQRFAIVVLAIGSLYIFEWLEGIGLYKAHIVHYLATMVVVFLLVGISGFFVELHPNAYRDIFLNYTAVYIGVVAVEIVYHRFKSKKD